MAGYSTTPLVKKLGLKAGWKTYVYLPPASYFDLLNPLPEDIHFKEQLRGDLNFIHVFVKDIKSFQSIFLKAKKCLEPDGMLWISWPKKASKVNTDLDENIIREFGLKNGLVDVKVCAIDDVWSGLKFVFRLSDRK